jgi:CheY-like chemotaxis protein
MARVPSVVQTDPSFRPATTTARRLAVTGRACANCGSLEIRPSNRRNALDILLACLFLAPFRCRVCRIRFYLLWRPSLAHPPEPPMAPLLVITPRRKILDLGLSQAPSIEPHALQPHGQEPRLISLPPVRPVAGNLEPVEAIQPSPVEAPLASPTLPAQPAAFSARGQIVILENDLSIRKLLRRLLERRGYATTELSLPEDLEGELRHRRADLLIMDIAAAGPPGLEAAVELSRAYPDLKILALSAESLNGNVIPGRLLALPKPFPLDSFVDCVDRLLDPSSLQDL